MSASLTVLCCAVQEVDEEGSVRIYASTQSTDVTMLAVAKLLGLPQNKVGSSSKQAHTTEGQSGRAAVRHTRRQERQAARVLCFCRWRLSVVARVVALEAR